MGFQNLIVAGTVLVRYAIRSKNFVDGVSGWEIRRDGTAQFNNVQVRGSLLIQGTPAGEKIIGDNATFGNPTIAFYKDGVAEPAKITGNRPFGTGVTGLQITSAATAAHSRGVLQVDEFGWRVFDATNAIPNMSIDWDTDPDTSWAHAEHPGGLSALRSDSVTTWFPLVIKGKAWGGATADTNSASTTFVTVTSANAVNVPVLADRTYKANVRCRVAGTVLNDRVQLIVADGTTQVGQDYLHRITGATTTFQDVEFNVYWHQFSTGTIANLNLRMCRFSGTGTVTVRVDPSNYFMVVEEVGDPALISGL